MRNIAIITIYDEYNFGNRLQNFAVHKCLRKLGFDVESISVKCIRNKKDVIKGFIPNVYKSYIHKMYACCEIFCGEKRLKYRRLYNFEKFTRRYMPTIHVKTYDGKLSKNISEKYDFFVAGGDQVWNPNFFSFWQYENMFLMFTLPEKKLCFAPSIGVSEIPDEWKEKYAECLKTFPEINVRERRGAEIIEELTGKKAEVFIDPTLMLTKEEWEEVSSKSVGQGKKYILEYFLGNSDEKDEEILGKYAIDGIERINILDINNPESYASGPAEFIDLIKNAELVYTDSFHACVFSIIFDTPFIIKRRDDNLIDMFSRIETLFELFEIDKQCIKKSIPVVVDKIKKEEILSREREKVNNYFRKYLQN